MSPATYTDLAHENYMLLTALWRLAWNLWGGWHCQICGGHADEKLNVRHQPGCALFGQDPALLAQLDAFDAMPEVV